MHALPAQFIQRIQSQFPEEADALLASLELPAKTSIHIHPEKGKCLDLAGIEVPWFSRGKILDERPSFTLDPLFHAGCYYPQESSSMFLYHVLEQLYGSNKNITLLDLCAAPGGKSILISSFLEDKGRLISNEIIRTRNSILRENLTKWGASNTVVTCNDPEDFTPLTHYFDGIIVDAPCSGEGMFRKDNASRNEWSMDNIKLCEARQRRIIEHVSPTIKPGGYLIYSTCTFAPQENEEQMAQLLASGVFEEICIAASADWQLRRLKHGVQFLPHQVPGEGFYMAVLRKIDSSSSTFGTKQKPVFTNATNKEQEGIKALVDVKKLHHIKTARNEFYASAFSAEELNQLVNHLYLTLPGIELGEFIKDDFSPAHALAMSQLEMPSVPKVEVELTKALQYLRGEALPLQGDKGKALITFQNMPLGWVKMLGNRANNSYPKEWRIRMR